MKRKVWMKAGTLLAAVILIGSGTRVLAEENRQEVRTFDAGSMIYQEGGSLASSEEAIDFYRADGSRAMADASRTQLKTELYQALAQREETLDISKYSVSSDDYEDLELCFVEVINEHPDLFYVDREFSVSGIGGILTDYSFNYKYSSEKTKEMQTQLDQKIAEAVALVDDSMPEEAKALVLHDYLAQHCMYATKEFDADTLSTVPNVYDAYGALVNGYAVCQGYTMAYSALLQKAGIEVDVSESNEMNHIWNVVQVDDEWYHVDVTWDDPSWNKEGRSAHEYFLLSDTEMENRGEEGQRHNNWVDSVDCNSDTYDSESYWWRSVNSRIVVADSKYYYIRQDSSTKKLQLIQRDGTSEKALYTSADKMYWLVWGSSNSFYTGTFSYLSKQGDYLYFNGPKELYKLKFASLSSAVTPEKVYTCNAEDGYIYGAMVYEDGKARLNIMKDPEEETDAYITESIASVTPVTGVSLDKTSLSLTAGESGVLTVTVAPDNATNKVVAWRSSDISVAEVDKDGKVTAKAAGSAVITAMAVDGSEKSASCTVTVSAKNDDNGSTGGSEGDKDNTGDGSGAGDKDNTDGSGAGDKDNTDGSGAGDKDDTDGSGAGDKDNTGSGSEGDKDNTGGGSEGDKDNTGGGSGTGDTGSTGGSTGNEEETGNAGLVQGSDGIWRYYKNDKFQSEYNGYVFFADSWWVVAGGQVYPGYTGLWGNDALGWWYAENGRINTAYSGFAFFADNWWLVSNGRVLLDYTGLWGNESQGWWYIENGRINFAFSGYAEAFGSWWVIVNGQVYFGYTGLWGNDAQGWWYAKNSVIDFSYTGTAKFAGLDWNVVNGQVVF